MLSAVEGSYPKITVSDLQAIVTKVSRFTLELGEGREAPRCWSCVADGVQCTRRIGGVFPCIIGLEQVQRYADRRRRIGGFRRNVCRSVRSRQIRVGGCGLVARRRNAQRRGNAAGVSKSEGLPARGRLRCSVGFWGQGQRGSLVRSRLVERGQQPGVGSWRKRLGSTLVEGRVPGREVDGLR